MNIFSSIGGFFGTPDGIVMMRLLAAVLLGAVVGFERERSGKMAGLRTHALVSLGSALFTVISILVYTKFPSVNGVAGYDYHLVANIIVGIGFIGGGAIMQVGSRVQGITTAASLWIVAAIGMASGFGLYKEAIATTVLVYVVLTVLWLVEKKLKHKLRYKHQGIYSESHDDSANENKNS